MSHRYFKDLKFQIAFFHHPGGISLDDIGSFFVHKSSKESAVISARGAKRIRNTDWSPIDASEKALYEIFKNIEIDRKVGDGLLINDMQKNHPEIYSEVLRWANGYSTDRLIVFAFGDGEFPEDFNSDLTPVVHRVGGVELVVEYLLSNFACAEVTNLPRLWTRLDGMTLAEQDENAMQWKEVDYMAEKGYMFAGWKYDFSTSSDFRHLGLVYSELVDDEFMIFKHHERFLNRIDQQAVEQMDRLVAIPSELWYMLTERQKGIWKDEKVPKII